MKIEDYQRIWGSKRRKNYTQNFYNTSFNSNHSQDLIDEENEKFFTSFNAQK